MARTNNPQREVTPFRASASSTLRLSLKQLEVFLALAAGRTTAQVATQLSLSQSAVSAALKSLEAMYTIDLFDRVGRQLVLNAAGQRVRAPAEALIARARELEAQLMSVGLRGDLALAASYTIANHLAVDYLADWLKIYPDAKVDIATGNSPDIVTRVLSHEVDLGMIENEIAHPEVELLPWLGDELLVFCRPDHPLALKAHISDDDLLSAHWILREKGSGARSHFDLTFASLLPQLRVFLEFQHNQPIERAIEQGLGIGCLSDRVVQPLIDSGRVVALRLNKRYTMTRRFYFVLRKGGYRTPAVSQFIAMCSDREVADTPPRTAD